jgi:hypothetical protein
VIFFSYAREDAAAVGELYRLMKAKGLQPWMDTQDIPPGADWALEIQRAIRRADFFFVFLSHSSVVKTGVLKDEIRAGVAVREANLAGEHFLIPVRLEEVNLPESLARYQWVDYFRDGGRARLLQVVGYDPLRAFRRTFVRYAAIAAALVVAGLVCWVAYRRLHDPVREFVAWRQSPGDVRADSTEALIGVTLWELRPSKDSDPPAVREIVHPEDRPATEWQWTAVRSKLNLSLALQAKFRIGIESSRAGYLYIVDRADYGSGLKPPVLIFPTTRIRGGNNYVASGSLVEVPPDFFELQSSGADYRGERVTILLSPAALPLSIGREQLDLNQAMFNRWQHDWSVPARLVHAEIGASAGIVTKGEVESKNNPQRMLGMDDPAPQYLFDLPAKPNAPLLFDFRITVAGGATIIKSS